MTLARSTLIGNLGSDPKIQDGKFGKVTNFSLATSRFISRDGTNERKTSWHYVTCYGKVAENAAKFLRKGSKVYVDAEIQVSKSVGKDNIERTYVNNVAKNIVFLDQKSKQDPQTCYRGTDPNPQPGDEFDF